VGPRGICLPLLSNACAGCEPRVPGRINPTDLPKGPYDVLPGSSLELFPLFTELGASKVPPTKSAKLARLVIRWLSWHERMRLVQQ
jgi:hypothetical protein